MKTTNRKNQLFVIMAVLVLVFAATALAQGQGKGSGHRMGRGHGGGFGQENRLEFLTEKLELSPDQSAAIGEIMESGRQQGLTLRKEMMRLQNELEGEMLKDEPSQDTALQLVKKIGDLRTEERSLKMKSRLEVREQLTPEQRDSMLMMKERPGQGRRGGQGRQGRFGGHAGSKCDRECDGEGPGRKGSADQDAN